MTRSPAVADAFYPADARGLTRLVDSLLARAPAPHLDGRLVGAVVPHAGYPYSGSTAAAVFRAIGVQKPKTVVIIGPTHQVYLEGFAVYDTGAWQTPLGTVGVDQACARDIVAAGGPVRAQPDAHRLEHSIEVQLPFLQRTLPSFQIVPIMVGDASWDDCLVLARVLGRIARDPDVLLLASSDLYHGESYRACLAADEQTLALVSAFNARKLFAALKTGAAQACGGVPIAVVLEAARRAGADHVAVIARTNSGDVTGTRTGYVVGYGGALILQGKH